MIEQAKADFLQAQQGLIRALDKTPPERQKWSPSETARSPLEVAAHAALAVGSMLGNLTGDTFAIPTTAEADVYFREAEKALDTRDQVVECLERNSRSYLDWLDTVTPETLATQMKVPFGFGEVPMTAGISFMAAHLNWHAAQIHYIQTIYGDRDWFQVKSDHGNASRGRFAAGGPAVHARNPAHGVGLVHHDRRHCRHTLGPASSRPRTSQARIGRPLARRQGESGARTQRHR